MLACLDIVHVGCTIFETMTYGDIQCLSCDLHTCMTMLQEHDAASDAAAVHPCFSFSHLAMAASC